MTEARERDRIDAVEALKLQLARWVEELALVEDACRHFGGFRSVGIAADKTERIKHEMGLAVGSLDRLFPTGAESEQTDRLIVTGQETCTRCHGTGEVPMVERAP